MLTKKKYQIISLGGSLLFNSEGIDVGFLRRFRQWLKKEIATGQKFVIVVGGGRICRQYYSAARQLTKVKNEEIEWMGIRALLLNAHLVQLVLRDWADPTIVQDPRKKLKTRKPVIIASGWKPGFSTDYDAVQQAITYQADLVVNLSNIEYVYTADPRTNPQAKKIVHISWSEFRREIVGNEWTPGLNLPFDPVASRLAQKKKIKVAIISGKNLSQISRALTGKKFKGTLIV
ncbi:MAG TPA: UMP kinase [Patescibacteria group bacterium]|nr:UMP kinase [Patescibacteria group bacterium]